MDQDHGLALAGLHYRDPAEVGHHGVEAQTAGLDDAARGGEEADAQVEVAAQDQAAVPERVHPAAIVAGDPVPGCGVAGDQGVSTVAVRGVLDLDAIAPDLRVPRALAADLEADPSAAAARHVHDVGLEALGKRQEALGRRGRRSHGWGPAGQSSGSARPTLSATQTGFSLPSASTVNFVTT